MPVAEMQKQFRRNFEGISKPFFCAHNESGAGHVLMMGNAGNGWDISTCTCMPLCVVLKEGKCMCFGCRSLIVDPHGVP